MAEAGARIGPNAVLQLVPVLDAHLGTDQRCALLDEAGIRVLPDGTSMIDEQPVARLHQVLRARHPERARTLATRAGTATGDYILAHRIPKPAQRLLRALPAWLSARLLAQAITKHAWTFAGSGQFRIASTRPLVFEIADNPVVRGEHAAAPVCDWHAAVFERLYRTLVAPDYIVEETHCAAHDDGVCRFELRRRPKEDKNGEGR
jgi:divinyl protochlorophyllide a 8-vinyl-reductase